MQTPCQTLSKAFLNEVMNASIKPSKLYTTICSVAVLETGSKLPLDDYSPPTLFNVFLKIITSDAVEKPQGKSQHWRSDLHYFRFTDNNFVNAEEEEEADDIVTSMDTTCTRYKMEIGPDKTKKMTNNRDGFQRQIQTKGYS